jgi:hypothetical protein
MRTNLLFAITFLIATSATNAQLTILPQVGFERSATNLQINNLGSFSPMDAQGTLKANIRADYKFKGGHGPFAGFGTSPATVAFKFTDPANAMNNFRTATNNLQWRLEGGYQYTSAPIYFKKKSTAAPSGLSSLHLRSKYKNAPESDRPTVQKVFTEKSCGSYSIRSHCEKKVMAFKKKDERLNMRIQPSVGMAYRPSVDESFERDGNSYQYNAGNWKSAVISGLAFELAKGAKRQATVGVHYTKGIGIEKETLNTVTDSKPSTTYFSSNASSWAVTLGVPISLAKKQTPVKEVKVIEYKKTEYKSKCGPKKVYI